MQQQAGKVMAVQQAQRQGARRRKEKLQTMVRAGKVYS
jgi:hypothetical protein